MAWQQVAPSDDVEAAAWIGPRLHPFAQDVGAVIPTGFAAYARGERRHWPTTPITDEVAGILARHTSTPERSWFCLWEGYGYLTGAVAIVTAWKLEPGQPLPPGPFIRRPPKPKLPESRVRLPNRAYLLFAGSVAQGAGWQDGPNLWWPEGRAWCVACEIDLDYALIGGSRELIDDIVQQTAAERVAVDAPL